ILVYDVDSHHIHQLSPDATSVWRLCNGHRSTAGVIRATGLPAAVVALALANLSAAGLLDGELPATVRAPAHNRRALLTKMAIGGAIGVPMILSVSAPSAATHVSGCFPAEQCPAVGAPCYTLESSDCAFAVCQPSESGNWLVCAAPPGPTHTPPSPTPPPSDVCIPAEACWELGAAAQ